MLARGGAQGGGGGAGGGRRACRELGKARGHTPAGTHRPIMVAEILEVLAPQPGEVALDATLGYGGHARELLPMLLPGGRLFGVDVDPLELPRTEARLRGLGYGEEVLTVRRMNFAGLPRLKAESGGFDLVLADLGVSSMQIDNPARGFTWKAEGPLDLRLNPQRGRSAAELLASLNELSLAELLVENSDEPHAEAIAREVQGQDIRTTRDLAQWVRVALRLELPEEELEAETKKALQRTFQALRIAVNDEFTVLDQFLALLPGCLRPGGRVAILTFHSGEDRRVKKAFQQGCREGLYAEVAPDPLRASPEERRSNPRSTSAKLRWARLSPA
ncbi:MAG: 16S rRNA (cytosine(1402)-N(4))-methyltransferase RsmH [Holophagaceae bacterium]|uniref:Ribosomal RNA small subunit methyltransferase H n=1 Tax=Candidatus Geothrix skivensis TaxID=2954439 RepID=A0A9D7SKU6_9BACT|nr:16S rRNA (cytosine(1402)-N(4))-methyltransferase RsmH [Candidatus Geothrix skivensis]